MEVKRFRADWRHVVETEFDDAQYVGVADFDRVTAELDALQQRLNELDGQHQGDAIGTLVRDYNERIVFTPIGDPHIIDDMKVYAHADPGEVERLRANLEMARRERNNYLGWCRDARGEAIKLRAQLAELTEAFSESQEEVVKHGKMLAEAQALLRDKSGDLIRMAAHLISAPLFTLQDLQDEDKRMTRSRVDHAVDVADARLKDAAYELRRIANALSASTEPSAPVEIDERAENK